MQVRAPPVVILFILVVAILLFAPGYMKIMMTAFIFTVLLVVFAENRRNNSQSKSKNNTSTNGVGGDVIAERNNTNLIITEVPPEAIKHVTPCDVYDEIEQAQQPDPVKTDYSEKNPYAWLSNPKFTSCYRPPAVEFNQCRTGTYLDYDEAHARLAALRQRDKKALDGVVTKNANYFKKHFGRELSDAEHERWWGNDAY